jgi:hypothetical protein
MAQLRDLYDKEVIDSIVQSYSDDEVLSAQAAAPKEDPYTKVETPEFKKGKGTKLFSELFWAPAHIPDIPIRVFEKKDWDANAQMHIPAVNPHWVWNQEVLELFALAMHSNDTTLPSGVCPATRRPESSTSLAHPE